ncbi:M43 family zinc metalloprotease [Persicitalea jodogahamensis]|nr:M43 family zinc metalloprotease [Persicitalea jodogahamensis]
MKYFSLFLLAGFTTVAAAQTPVAPDSLPRCGVTSSFLEKNIDPQLLQQMNTQWQANSKKSKANGRLSADDPVLVVPVMFHIAHLGEAVGEGSNLSEGRIQAALAALNNIYRARGQYADANDTRIEFVLANCSGIDRANASSVPDFINKGVIYGGSNQQQVKDIFGPYQNKFINIYVSHMMTGAGGYAYYGGDMFITTYGLPNKGNQPEGVRLLAHELGHSLFLDHTFSGDNSCLGCSNDNVACPANGNPFNNGDQVADTPPHRVYDLNYFTPAYATNPCTNEPFGLDLVKNHMAYNTDARRFSPGQIARMRFFLENYLGYWRNSDAVPTPNNQIALSSVPANVCVGTPVAISYDNNSGSSSPTLLIQKGEDIVYYVDATSSPANFEFPKYRNGFIRDDYKLENGTDYRVQVAAGCNSRTSDSFKVKNLSQYTALIVGADGNNFPNSGSNLYLYPCTSSSLTLKAKFTFTVQGVTHTVPDSELSAYNFQWTYNGNPIPGATGSTFVVTSNRSGGSYRYSATGATCPGPINSYTTANVYPSTSAYNFTSDWDGSYSPPRSQCEGRAVMLYAGYVSNSATYDWYRDGVLLPGETSRTLSATATGTYKVVARDGSCSVNSSALDGISLHFGTLLENRIIINSGDSTICSRTDLASTATQPNQGFSYQWLRNGSNIPNATESYLTASTAGIYSLRLTQGNCQSVSNGIDLKKGSKQEKPIITGPKSFVNGLTHYLYVENINNVGIEWFRDGQPLTNNLYTHLAVSSSGVYTVRKGYNECVIESDPFVANFGSTITPQIESNDTVYVACNDQSSYLYLRFKDRYYENSVGLTFRWIKDGNDLPADQATGTYYYPKEPGVYRLRVTKDGNSGLSNPITVTTTSDRTVKLTAEQGVLSTCSGNVVKLIFPEVGNYNIPLVWKRDGVVLANQYRSKLTAYESGSYTATYQGDGCTVTTDPLPVTIGSGATSATLSGDYAIRTGETANLLLTAPAGLSYFFKLSDGSEYKGQGATTLIPKSPNLSTTYTLTGFGTYCGLGNASGTAQIDVTKCPEGTVNTTLATGYWDTPANWSCGSVPTVLDLVRVSAPHTIYLPMNYGAKSKSVELLGNILQEANTILRMGQE